MTVSSTTSCSSPASDRLFVQLQIRQNDRHAQRMNDIWLTGLALLALVGLIGRPVGLSRSVEISSDGWYFADSCNQLLIQLIRAGKILHLS